MSETITQIESRLARLRSERSAHNAAWRTEEQDLLERLHRARLASRPTYPTASQKGAITEVARLVRGGGLDTASGAQGFLGEPVLGDASVLYSAQNHRINIFALAPYVADATGIGARLWTFTDDERRTIAEAIGETGLRIVSTWKHDDGIAFIVADTAA